MEKKFQDIVRKFDAKTQANLGRVLRYVNSEIRDIEMSYAEDNDTVLSFGARVPIADKKHAETLVELKLLEHAENPELYVVTGDGKASIFDILCKASARHRNPYNT